MTTFKDAKSGAAITVKVTPRARKTGVIGVMDDGTVRIRVAAVPEEGAANAALIEFLAGQLGIKPGQVEIVAGLSSERKLISIIGVSPAQVEAVLKPAEADEGEGRTKPKKAGKLKSRK
jgi:hypothetical protein